MPTPDIQKTVDGLQFGAPDAMLDLEVEYPQGATSVFVAPSELNEGNEREFIELLRVAFDGGPNWFELPVPPLDHFRWKFRDFPGVVVVERLLQAGTLSGMIVHTWWPWLAEGHLRSCRVSVELALHPSLQGKGIQSARLEYRRQHPERVEAPGFSFRVSTHPTAQHLARRMGTPEAGNRLETLMKLLDVRGYVRMQHHATEPGSGSRTMVALRAQRRRLPRPYAARLAVWWLRHLRSAFAALGHRRSRRRTWTLRTIEQFDGRIKQFVDLASQQFDLILFRSEDYLNWRFCDRRAGPFTVRLAEQDGEILGYAVFRPSHEVGVFADLLVLPGRTDVAASLVDDAVAELKAGGALAVRTWMLTSHPYNPILKAAGFFPTANLGELTYEDFTPDKALSFLNDPLARVHYMMGDSDGL